MVKKIEELIKYQAKFPDKLEVQITKSDDFGYAIKILNLPGCFTQVENPEELLIMVNDAVYTYFDVPENLIISMPKYFPTQEIREEMQNWEKSIPIDLLEKSIVFTPIGIGI